MSLTVGNVTAASFGFYNDGAWHYVSAACSEDRVALLVDGAEAASAPVNQTKRY